MFVINEDMSIYVTRGDEIAFPVKSNKYDSSLMFRAGDTVRIKVFGKKACDNVVMVKYFDVTEDTDTLQISLSGSDTKIGGIINKPTDYWYEIELNPDTHPQTVLGYDKDGAKIFRLYPEGKDITEGELPNNVPLNEIQHLIAENIKKATDQTYNPQSENAQSGIALAGILFPKKTIVTPALDASMFSIYLENISSYIKDFTNLDIEIKQVKDEVITSISPNSVNKCEPLVEGKEYIIPEGFNLTGTLTLSCTVDYDNGEFDSFYAIGTDEREYAPGTGSHVYDKLENGLYRFHITITLPNGVYLKSIRYGGDYGEPNPTDWCLVEGTSYDYVPVEYETSSVDVDFTKLYVIDAISGQKEYFEANGTVATIYLCAPQMILNVDGDYEDIENYLSLCEVSVTYPFDRLKALESALGTATETLSILVDPAKE